ncbi:MAG: hypothetical protein IT369_10580 [Candidatus Latescibacteria bacterium]|nr:hypothetical protein [Candidatus Latescibacterota bacterium]
MGSGSKKGAGSGCLAGLAAELSVVINRVRRAFGGTPMADFAGQPEVLAAARRVNQVAGQVARGESSRAAWREALAQYEACWLQQLGASRASRAA